MSSASRRPWPGSRRKKKNIKRRSPPEEFVAPPSGGRGLSFKPLPPEGGATNRRRLKHGSTFMVSGAERRVVYSRGRRRAYPAQRHIAVHVHRADAQCGQPLSGHVFAPAR